MLNNKMSGKIFIWMFVSSLLVGAAVALAMRFANPKADMFRKSDGTIDDLKFVYIVWPIAFGTVFILEIITWLWTKKAIISAVKSAPV